MSIRYQPPAAAISASSSSSINDTSTFEEPPHNCCRCDRDDNNYLDAGVKLWYSLRCRHALCDRCKREMYGRHRVNNCPFRGCGATLTPQDFVSLTREQQEYEEEKRVRKRLNGIFNKTWPDFLAEAQTQIENARSSSSSSSGTMTTTATTTSTSTTSATSMDAKTLASSMQADYTERVESYIASLTRGTERQKQEVEAAIGAYKQENQYQISLNAAHTHTRIAAEAEKLAAEAAMREAAARAAAASDLASRQAAERVRRHIVDVIVGEKRLLGTQEKEGLEMMKLKLQELQATKRKAQAATIADGHSLLHIPGSGGGGGGGVGPLGSLPFPGSGVGAPPLPSPALLLSRHVPCPTIFPPRFVSLTHSGWSTLPVTSLPTESVQKHQRAGGYDIRALRKRSDVWVMDSLGFAL